MSWSSFIADVPWFERNKGLGAVLITFTVPENLRFFMRSHQRVAYVAPFKSSAEAIKKLARDERYIGGDLPGFFGVLHTWGRTLQSSACSLCRGRRGAQRWGLAALAPRLYLPVQRRWDNPPIQAHTLHQRPLEAHVRMHLPLPVNSPIKWIALKCKSVDVERSGCLTCPGWRPGVP